MKDDVIPGGSEDGEEEDAEPAASSLPDPKFVEMLEELDALYGAMMDDEARNSRVYDDTEAALGRIARKHFPDLGRWDADLLRKLADVIARAAWKHFAELDKLQNEHERRAQGEPPRPDRGSPPR